jgi:cytochrome P450
MMSFVFLYLARHPEPRATLRARPDLIVNAADELIRRHGLVASTGVLTRDVEMHGAAMKADEHIILPNSFAGLDTTLFPDPWTVDIERKGWPARGLRQWPAPLLASASRGWKSGS